MVLVMHVLLEVVHRHSQGLNTLINTSLRALIQLLVIVNLIIRIPFLLLLRLYRAYKTAWIFIG